MLGNAAQDVLSVDDAAAALAAATRVIEQARVARELLDEEERAAEAAVTVAAYRRADAVCAVVKSAPELAALWARFQAAQQQVEDLAWTLSATLVAGELFRWDGRLRGSDRGQGDAWKRAIAALETDPDAALPQ